MLYLESGEGIYSTTKVNYGGKILESKYGGQRNLASNRRSNKESIWWHNLGAVCGSNAEGRWFNENIKWSIGCRSNVRFWEDGWLDTGICMMDKYQCLYCISEQRQQFNYQMGRLVDGTWEWNLLWRRDQLESELALASNFMVDVEALGVVGIRSFVGGIYHALHHSVLAL